MFVNRNSRMSSIRNGADVQRHTTVITAAELQDILHMVLTLYSVSDGPPSLSVRMALKLLNLDYKLVEVDFASGEHLKEDYAKKNPQKEIPTLDDDGFLLSESVAILQYLADSYGSQDSIYPKYPKDRAVVNHRLAFNIASYYRNIGEYVMAPIFFNYERSPIGLKKVHIVLEAFNTILENQGKKYAAGDSLTIGDLPLISATLCLEAVNLDFTKYKCISKWYNNFKNEYPGLWAIAEEGMKEIQEFNNNPPLLTELHHPIHPVRH